MATGQREGGYTHRLGQCLGAEGSPAVFVLLLNYPQGCWQLSDGVWQILV